MNTIWIWSGSIFNTEDDAMRAYYQDTSKDHTLRGKSKPKRYVEEPPRYRKLYLVETKNGWEASHPDDPMARLFELERL